MSPTCPFCGNTKVMLIPGYKASRLIETELGKKAVEIEGTYYRCMACGLGFMQEEYKRY